MRALRLLVAPALLLVALPVSADAPLGHYEAFVRETPEITDTQTKLTWERFPTPTKRTLAIAETGCTSTFSGRLPTIKELLTLVDEEPHSRYEGTTVVQKAIDRGAFGSDTKVDAPYWSNTPTGTAGEVWGVSFKDGTMVRTKTTDQAYARCVK